MPLGGSGQPSICSQAGLPDAAQIESYLDQLLQLALEIPIPESESEKNDLKKNHLDLLQLAKKFNLRK